jgi:uncharacterized protein (TIGR03437 family)
VAGATTSGNFPTTANAYQKTYKGSGGQKPTFTFSKPLINTGDGFVAKLDPNGSNLIFSTYLGGINDDAASAIAVDSAGNVYVGGSTLSFNFPVTTGALQTKPGGVDVNNQFFNTGDGFITKLKPDGSDVIYSTFFGGIGDDWVQALAVDSAGDVYFTGNTGTQNLPTTAGAYQAAYSGPKVLPGGIEDTIGDAFVGKLNPAGSALVYLTYLGGAGNDSATSLAIDAAGNAYIAGFSDSTNFPLSADAAQKTMAGDTGSVQFLNFGDGFLSILNTAGTQLLYSTYLGGNRDDLVFGLALDSAGNIYLAGNTYSSNFPATANANQKTFGGAQQIPFGFPWGDAFYAKFNGLTPPGPAITSVTNAFGDSATIAANTWVAIKGSGLGTDPGRIWQSPDFPQNGTQMPTALDGIGATMNGKNTFMYFISGAQLNILTPPDLAPGPVQVQVKNGSATSPAFTVQAAAVSASFFVFNGGPYVIATHLDGTDIGAATLFPGVTTPAHPGETVIIYGNGFGTTSVPVVSGSVVQGGTLSPMPVFKVGGTTANVSFAGLFAGIIWIRRERDSR